MVVGLVVMCQWEMVIGEQKFSLFVTANERNFGAIKKVGKELERCWRLVFSFFSIILG